MAVCRRLVLNRSKYPAVVPDVFGAARLSPCRTGAFRVAGTGWLVRPVCGRVYDRRQEVRNASSQGQVRLIFSMGGAADQLGGQHP